MGGEGRLMAPAKEPASITNDQGVYWIDELLETIEADEKLKANSFGISVRASLRSVRTRLKGGAFFSASMQQALDGWDQAINRDRLTDPKQIIN
jgi:hypothetical protein